MLTIGLTGGIGSGKSTVARILAERGAPIIDADQVGHAIYQRGGPAYLELVRAFGETILAADRSVDRKRLGAIVFADPAALKKLNAIVHPKMFERMREMAAGMRARGERRPIVLEAAVLIEASWTRLCDEVWLVIASRERVIERIERDRGMKREETAARIKAQLSDEERRKYATVVIENEGTIEQLRQRVAGLWAEALERNG
jgi:dephospho-CoA kinase